MTVEEYRKLPENWVVNRDVGRDVSVAVNGTMSGAVSEDVYLAVDNVVVDEAVHWAVYLAVYQDFNGGFKEPPSKLSSLAVVVTIARILWGAIMAWLRVIGRNPC